MTFDYKEILKWPRLQFKKLRIMLAWLGGIILFLNLDITDESFLAGAPIALVGELIRIWASGHMEKKGEKLATGGPFAYTRNPLYVGSFLIGLGIVTVCGDPYFILLFLAGYGFVYWGTVKKEENDLSQLFGETYRRYCLQVPRFFPRFTPYPDREKTVFQPRFLVKHREQVAMMGVLLLLSGLYLWGKLMLDRESIGWKEGLAIGTASAMAAGLLTEWLLRVLKKEKKKAGKN